MKETRKKIEIDGKPIYLQQNNMTSNYRIVYPYKGEDGKLLWKNLFRIDGMLIFLVVMALFLAWAYNHDVKTCQETITNLPTIACQYCDDQRELMQKKYEPNLGWVIENNTLIKTNSTDS